MRLFSADRQAVGQLAATIRSKRPPSPYGSDNKGIRYRDESPPGPEVFAAAIASIESRLLGYGSLGNDQPLQNVVWVLRQWRLAWVLVRSLVEW